MIDFCALNGEAKSEFVFTGLLSPTRIGGATCTGLDHGCRGRKSAEQQQQNLSLRGGFFVGASLDPARRDKKRESDRRYRQKIKDEEKKLGLDFNKLTEDVEWLKIEILPYSEKRQVDEKLKFLEGEVYRRRIELADLQQKLKITRDQREILEKMLPLDEQGTSHSNAHENAPENLEEACRIIKKKQMYLDALLDEKIRKQEKN